MIKIVHLKDLIEGLEIATQGFLQNLIRHIGRRLTGWNENPKETFIETFFYGLCAGCWYGVVWGYLRLNSCYPGSD